ncbi:MAG: hypothetical protein ACK5RU_10730 [Hyphomonadaceae bacterium]
MAGRSISIRNIHAAIAWLFMVVWMSGLVALTGTWVQAGMQIRPTIITLLILGWIAAPVGLVVAFGSPLNWLTFADGWVTVREIWLWKQRKTRFALIKSSLRIIRTKDSDGGPYFRLDLIGPEGLVIIVAQSHQEAKVKATRDQLIAEIGAAAP